MLERGGLEGRRAAGHGSDLLRSSASFAVGLNRKARTLLRGEYCLLRRLSFLIRSFSNEGRDHNAFVATKVSATTETPPKIAGSLLKWQVWALRKVHSATALSVKGLVKQLSLSAVAGPEGALQKAPCHVAA